MNKRAGFLFLCLSALVCWQSCKQKPTPAVQEDTVNSGTINIAADESAQAIVDEIAYIFKHFNEKANLHISYQTENAVLRRLLNDSVRFAILTRDLNAGEKKILTERTLPPVTQRFAIDAVTLIVNQASADTQMTVSDVKKMLNGQTKTNMDIVFDNPNSSLVRYLKDFSGNKELKLKNVFAVKNNKEVIKYISQHPQAIGIAGFSWLNDPDKDYADAVTKVKIVSIRDENSKKDPKHYFKPSQTTLALNQYPFARSLYLVDCTGRMGLGAGFNQFVMSDRGQRIILRSGILPEAIPPREIIIKRNF